MKIGESKLGGANVKMWSTAHDDLQSGPSQIKIYEVESRPNTKRSFYTFEGVLSQEGVPRLTTKVITMVNGSFDVNAFADRYN